MKTIAFRQDTLVTIDTLNQFEQAVPALARKVEFAADEPLTVWRGMEFVGQDCVDLHLGNDEVIRGVAMNLFVVLN